MLKNFFWVNLHFYFFFSFLFSGLFKQSEVVKIDPGSPNHPLSPNFKPTISKIVDETQERDNQGRIVKVYNCKLAEFPRKKTYRLSEEEFNSFPKDHTFYLHN